MKFKPVVSVGIMVLFMASYGCKKGTGESMVVFVPPSGEEFNQTRTEALFALKQHFQFDAQQGGTFTSPKGVTVHFPANSVRLNGSTVYGQVDVEYLEIIDRGDMLVSGISSNSAENGDKKAVVSGGAFFVKATQGEQDLDIQIPYEITVPGSLTQGVDEDMVLYHGGYFLQNIAHGWQRIVDGLSYVEFTTDQYKATVNYCGWSNIAKVYADSGPKTTVKARVPSNCAMDNALVCIMYGSKYLLYEFDKASDSQEADFIAGHELVPVGQECHILFFTAKDNDWAYVIHKTTIVQNHLERFNATEIKSVSKGELMQLVNQLP